MIIIRTLIITLFFTFSTFAVENLTISAEAQDLLAEIRCITCQGQTVLGSNSEFAEMITNFVIAQLDYGKSTSEIKQELVQIYGDDILMTPAFSMRNLLLWMAPGLFVLLLGFVIMRRAK